MEVRHDFLDDGEVVEVRSPSDSIRDVKRDAGILEEDRLSVRAVEDGNVLPSDAMLFFHEVVDNLRHEVGFVLVGVSHDGVHGVSVLL